MTGDGRDLIFVGDVHIERDDADLAAFLRFLDRLGESAARVVLLGDLFNLWIGRAEMEQPHHAAVLGGLVRLRDRGIVVRYVEGNRDYHVGARHAGRALDDAGSFLEERFGGRSLLAVHGDLANPRDTRYRVWRRISRSWGAWALFRMLPRAARLALVESLEQRMRGSNADFKGGFPDPVVRAYGARLLSRGHDAVVLGHFHVERELRVGPPALDKRVFVLPEWKGSRRHLRVSARGEMGFEPSPC